MLGGFFCFFLPAILLLLEHLSDYGSNQDKVGDAAFVPHGKFASSYNVDINIGVGLLLPGVGVIHVV